MADTIIVTTPQYDLHRVTDDATSRELYRYSVDKTGIEANSSSMQAAAEQALATLETLIGALSGGTAWDALTATQRTSAMLLVARCVDRLIRLAFDQVAAQTP